VTDYHLTRLATWFTRLLGRSLLLSALLAWLVVLIVNQIGELSVKESGGLAALVGFLACGIQFFLAQAPLPMSEDD
jgi:hypothetical protein